MICPTCGASIVRLEDCGCEHKIKSGLVYGILVTLCCCIPLGIVSIVYAARVSDLVAAGQYTAAAEEARKAKTWAIVGAILGFISNSAYLIYQIIYVIPNE